MTVFAIVGRLVMWPVLQLVDAAWAIAAWTLAPYSPSLMRVRTWRELWAKRKGWRA